MFATAVGKSEGTEPAVEKYCTVVMPGTATIEASPGFDHSVTASYVMPEWNSPRFSLFPCVSTTHQCLYTEIDEEHINAF